MKTSCIISTANIDIYEAKFSMVHDHRYGALIGNLSPHINSDQQD